MLITKEATLHDDFMSTNCCSFKGTKIPNHIHNLDQGFVAPGVLITKEATLHDDFMSTNCCSLKSNKIPNQIIVWTKGSLRPACSTPKRPQCTGTSCDELLFRQSQQDPDEIVVWTKGSLRFMSTNCCSFKSNKIQITVWTKGSLLVVLNIKETAKHDDLMSTNCRSLKSNKIPHQIIIWAKGSLRSSCSTQKRLRCTMTSCRRTVARSKAEKDPTSDHSLDQGIVALVVLNIKETAAR